MELKRRKTISVLSICHKMEKMRIPQTIYIVFVGCHMILMMIVLNARCSSARAHAESGSIQAALAKVKSRLWPILTQMSHTSAASARKKENSVSDKSAECIPGHHS